MKKIYYIVILVFSLLIIRFIDMYIFWHLGKMETEYLNSRVMTKEEIKKNYYFNFIGFALDQDANGKLKMFSETRSQNIVVVGYYNFYKQFVFLIHCKKGGQLYLPWLVSTIRPGVTKISIWRSDLVQTCEADMIKKTEFSEVLGSILTWSERGRGIFSGNYLESHSKYLHIIHIIRFFIPMLIIFLLPKFFSPRIFLAARYFFIMLILFFTPTYWQAPQKFLQLLTGYNFDGPLAFILLILKIIFYYYIYQRIKKSRAYIGEQRMGIVEKWLLAAFMLLPFVFRV